MKNKKIGKVLQIIGLIFFLVPFFAAFILMAGGVGILYCLPAVFVIGIIGFVLVVLGAVMSGGSNIFRYHPGRQRIPPVQYPRQTQIKRTRESIKEISCPNCGAPPKYIDHYGICMCQYCETKFKVR